MLQVSHFAVPGDLDKLNAHLNEHAADIAPEGVKIFPGSVVVIIDTASDQENALGAARANLRQSKVAITNLDVAIAKYRRAAAKGGKNEQSIMHKLADAEAARQSTLDDIAIQEKVIASIEDGSWLDEVPKE